MQNKNIALFALASIPLLMTLGNSMFIPVLPIIEKEIGITSYQSSLIITIYSAVAIFLIPLAGYLSDHFGRKKVIIPSLFLVGVGGLISSWAAVSLADPYMVILLGRFLQGAGAAGASPVVLPTVGDLFTTDKEVSSGLGLIETSNTFGKVLSPILGAILATWAWYIPFWSVPILSMISILLIFFLVKPPKGESTPIPFRTFIKLTRKIFKCNGRWLFGTFIIGGINTFILFGFLIYLSSVLEDTYKVNGVAKGLYLAIPLLILCLASYFTGKRIGEETNLMKRLILFGNMLITISLITMVFMDSLSTIIIVLSATGLGIGICLPCLDALITEGIDKEERGTITSIYSSTRFIGVALGPPVVSILLKQSVNVVFITLAIICLISIIFTITTLKGKSNLLFKA
ncbi:MFS transporter [Pseudalkalibacillus berkeleyi]|uniref:MFS transporter n=1 Tax=Pseudalkalibacillus berkeleyi TaxID=1069813 RepID=A0ABS9H100_9BACL|nr:MFS transporter [Pseudalkalibacillus berkeleyi]MCF6137482.1 MFS transporter [Pseudalkalibacillus berkeleyi]